MKTIILNSSNKSIEFLLESPVASALEFTAHYADNAGAIFSESSSDGVSVNSGPVTVVEAPSAGSRLIRSITVYNPNSGSATFTLRLKNGSDYRTICKTTLAGNETWTTDGTYDSDGKLKTSGSGTSAAVAAVDICNYVKNPDFEKDLTYWNTYSNTASTVPVTGAGGTPAATFTLTKNMSSPLFGTADALITKDSVNRQGHGVSTDFTIDNALAGNTLDITFYYKTSTSYASGDLGVYIYDVTNNLVIFPNVVDVPACASSTKFSAKWTASSNSTSYRLVLHVKGTGTSAWTMELDSVKVQENKIIQSGAMSDWVSWTPTGSWTTNATYSGKWRRVGDSMEGQIKISLSGAPNASQLIVNLPFTFDATKDVGGGFVGTGTCWQPGSGFYVMLASVYNNTSLQFNSDQNGSWYSNTNPISFGSGAWFIFTFKVPIAGWSSNIQLVTPSISPDKAGFLQMSCGSAGAGWALADGSSYNIKDYPDLHTNVGYSFLDITDICSGGTAISGGDYSGFPASNAFNNDYFTSVWASNQQGSNINGATPAYIGYDFGSGNTKHIRHIRWLTYNYNGSNTTSDVDNISSVKIQYSDDNSTWTDVPARIGTNAFATQVSIPTTPGVFVTLELASTSNHRYWRILANASLAFAASWIVNELEMSELSPTSNFIDMRGITAFGAGTTDRVDGKDAAGNFYKKQLAQYHKDQFEKHNHLITRPNDGKGVTHEGNTGGSVDFNLNPSVTATSTGDAGVRFNASSVISDGTNELRAGAETRPAGVGVNFYVKLYNDTVPAVELPLDSVLPVATIISHMPGYFTNGNNSGYTAVSNIAPNSSYWKKCDGSAPNDQASPIWNTSTRYLPNLTDSRFLMGGTVGEAAGSNVMSNHLHTISGTVGGSDGTHTHTDSGHTHNVSNISGTARIAVLRGQEGSPSGVLSKSIIIQGPAVSNSGAYAIDVYDLQIDSNPTANSSSANITNVGSGHGHGFSLSAGTGVNPSTGTLENRPKYLGCDYYIKIR